jgi:hypothetical protein
MHTLGALFQQLGLPSDQTAIETFIAEHSPLDSAVRLYQAPFWNKAQSDFLRDEILEDADWAMVIDELDADLRGGQLFSR